MAGDNASARLAEVQAQAQARLRALGLPVGPSANGGETERLLSMPAEQTRGMSNEALMEAAFALHQEARYVQQKLNECRSLARWCDANIRHLVAEEASRLPGSWYEERRVLAVRRSPAALALEAAKAEMDLLAGWLAYQPERIREQAEMFKAIAWQRRRKEDE
jgi:hypothetical protein